MIVNTSPHQFSSETTGVTMTLLWENAAHTSAFAAQTLNIPGISAFHMVLVVAKSYHSSEEIESVSCLIYPGGFRYLSFQWQATVSSFMASRFYGRSLLLDTNDNISFESGQTGGAADDTKIIPYRIYGIKL